VSNVQFRAGSSFRESGGTLHPADQLIADPRYKYDNRTLDFDVGVARVSDNVFANLDFDNTILIWVITRLMRGGIWFTN